MKFSASTISMVAALLLSPVSALPAPQQQAGSEFGAAPVGASPAQPSLPAAPAAPAAAAPAPAPGPAVGSPVQAGSQPLGGATAPSSLDQGVPAVSGPQAPAPVGGAPPFSQGEVAPFPQGGKGRSGFPVGGQFNGSTEGAGLRPWNTTDATRHRAKQHHPAFRGVPGMLSSADSAAIEFLQNRYALDVARENFTLLADLFTTSPEPEYMFGNTTYTGISQIIAAINATMPAGTYANYVFSNSIPVPYQQANETGPYHSAVLYSVLTATLYPDNPNSNATKVFNGVVLFTLIKTPRNSTAGAFAGAGQDGPLSPMDLPTTLPEWKIAELQVQPLSALKDTALPDQVTGADELGQDDSTNGLSNDPNANPEVSLDAAQEPAGALPAAASTGLTSAPTGVQDFAADPAGAQPATGPGAPIPAGSRAGAGALPPVAQPSLPASNPPAAPVAPGPAVPPAAPVAPGSPSTGNGAAGVQPGTGAGAGFGIPAPAPGAAATNPAAPVAGSGATNPAAPVSGASPSGAAGFGSPGSVAP